MKKFIYLILALSIIACVPQNKPQDSSGNPEISPSKNDDGEWDLQVIDTQYDYFHLCAPDRKGGGHIFDKPCNRTTFTSSKFGKSDC